MMNGTEGIKNKAINKAKQVGNAVAPNGNNNGNGNGNKKRRKQDLKPIITTEQQQGSGGNPYR